MLIEIVHWLSLIVAGYLSLRLSRDLADLSQWLVQTPCHTTRLFRSPSGEDVTRAVALRAAAAVAQIG